MRKFIAKIVLLFAIIAICDYVFGLGMGYVVRHINIGGQGRDNYICDVGEDDIMVFGSSRAVHHYNASMLEDSLGMTCYNCGDDNNGIILSYGRLMMAKERHQPKVIIEDVEPFFDLFKDDDHKYLGWLKAHYDRQGVSEIFDAIDPTERYKMWSQMYRYNSKFLQNLVVFFTSLSTDTGIKGFRPLHEDFDPMRIDKNYDRTKYEFDPLKLEFVNKMIDLSEGSKLYFIVSPMWYGMDSAWVAPVRDICRQRNVPFLDFSNDPKYVHNNQLFKDGIHLNAKGADEFTRDLIRELRGE